MTPGRPRFRKTPYYLRSLVALVRLATAVSVARCAVAGRGTVVLRNGTRIDLGSRLELLVIEECWMRDVYGIREVPPTTVGLVVDIGAGVGELTLLALRSLPHATIHAFEPNPRSFRLLERNVARLGTASVRVVPAAVGADATYRVPASDTGPLATVVPKGDLSAGTIVPGVRLDDAVPAGDVALLKVDCEGLELDVLESGPGVLGRTSTVVVEYHRHLSPESDRRVEALLSEHGFDVVVCPDRYDDRTGYVRATRSRPAPDPRTTQP